MRTPLPRPVVAERSLGDNRTARCARTNRCVTRHTRLGRGACGVLTTPKLVATCATVETQSAPLFDELVRQCFGAQTAVRRVAALAGDASTRRYARLWLDGPSAPASVVAMMLADRGIALSSEELARSAGATDRTAVRQRASLSVQSRRRCPRALRRRVRAWCPAARRHRRHGAVGRRAVAIAGGCVCVSTNAPSTSCCSSRSTGRGGTTPAASPSSRHSTSACTCGSSNTSSSTALNGASVSALPPDDAAVLRRHFAAIARRLDAAPRYLNHRDFHSWNLFVQDGAIRVIDFQDALLAAGAVRSGDAARRPRHAAGGATADRGAVARLLPRALGGSLGAALWIGGQFEEVYFLCALQKALKVVGRFYFLDIEKGKPGYLRYIPSTVRQIERILPRFPEHAEMASVLRKHLPR